MIIFNESGHLPVSKLIVQHSPVGVFGQRVEAGQLAVSMGWYEFSLPWGFLWSQTADSVIIMSLAHLSPSPLVITHWVWWAEVFWQHLWHKPEWHQVTLPIVREHLTLEHAKAKRWIIQRPKWLAQSIIYTLLSERTDKYFLNCWLSAREAARLNKLSKIEQKADWAFHLRPIVIFLTRLYVIVSCKHFLSLQLHNQC